MFRENNVNLVPKLPMCRSLTNELWVWDQPDPVTEQSRL
ncbi:hypothetical protein CES86_3848 [Brucella lupini]|uniref:Uncharacterized protein n=1 Tax=Brucella lupini TaxID=255457 RepID=A0A256GHH1_9HYPH|nr:hypothetical protein CES86_3848 [Brucella lupini]